MLGERNSGMGESGLQISLETKPSPLPSPCASLLHQFSLRSLVTSLDPVSCVGQTDGPGGGCCCQGIEAGSGLQGAGME